MTMVMSGYTLFRIAYIGNCSLKRISNFHNYSITNYYRISYELNMSAMVVLLQTRIPARDLGVGTRMCGPDVRLRILPAVYSIRMYVHLICEKGSCILISRVEFGP